MAFRKLIKYGEWSGPGWTAGLETQWFQDQAPGYDRVLTDADRAVEGIDAYDNYVAKAHDINEYAAIDALRQTLERLGLISNETTALGSRRGYGDRLIYPSNGDEPARFASFNSYLKRLHDMGAGDQAIEDLRYAFAFYYLHAALSNRQFAIDYVLNRPTIWNALQGSFRMEFQLRFGPSYFLEEASNLAAQANTIGRGGDIVWPHPDAQRRYLRDHFVTPDADYFTVVRDTEYLCVLTLDALADATQNEIAQLQRALLDAVNSGNSRLPRIFRTYCRDGADSVYKAIAVLGYRA